MEVGGYSPKTKGALSILVVFGMGFPASLIDKTNKHHKGTLLRRYDETKERLQKIKNACYTVVSIWGCEFRKLLRENPGFENENN